MTALEHDSLGYGISEGLRNVVFLATPTSLASEF
jgi:hypothetical protein